MGFFAFAILCAPTVRTIFTGSPFENLRNSTQLFSQRWKKYSDFNECLNDVSVTKEAHDIFFITFLSEIIRY